MLGFVGMITFCERDFMLGTSMERQTTAKKAYAREGESADGGADLKQMQQEIVHLSSRIDKLCEVVEASEKNVTARLDASEENFNYKIRCV